jgi:hypothetical protein
MSGYGTQQIHKTMTLKRKKMQQKLFRIYTFIHSIYIVNLFAEHVSYIYHSQNIIMFFFSKRIVMYLLVSWQISKKNLINYHINSYLSVFLLLNVARKSISVFLVIL